MNNNYRSNNYRQQIAFMAVQLKSGKENEQKIAILNYGKMKTFRETTDPENVDMDGMWMGEGELRGQIKKEVR